MTIKHPLTERGWLKKALLHASRNRETIALMRKGVTLVDINDNPLVDDLVKLVNKYATEACWCDAMNGWQCPIHKQVRQELKETLDKHKDSDSLKNIRIEG